MSGRKSSSTRRATIWCQAFAGLEQDIANKAIAHRHICFAAEQPITLDKALIIDTASLLQQPGGRFDLLITLDSSVPIFSNETRGRSIPRLCAATDPMTAN
jgi:hypothetical protein